MYGLHRHITRQDNEPDGNQDVWHFFTSIFTLVIKMMGTVSKPRQYHGLLPSAIQTCNRGSTRDLRNAVSRRGGGDYSTIYQLYCPELSRRL